MTLTFDPLTCRPWDTGTPGTALSPFQPNSKEHLRIEAMEV